MYRNIATVVYCVASILISALAATSASAQTDPRIQSSSGDCAHVRPGAHVVTSVDTGGTLNFLFRGSDGRRYVGTAGHLLADEATHVWRANGPTAEIDDGTEIGRAVFAWNYNAEPKDFALIRLARGVEADPAVCHWGGPTDVNGDTSLEPAVLRIYGNGMGVSEVAPERTLVAPTLANPSMVGALGVAIFGDSGSPVITEDGRALGIQVFVGALWGDPNAGLTPGNVGIYRLGPQVKAAEEALGIDLKLLTAPPAA